MIQDINWKEKFPKTFEAIRQYYLKDNPEMEKFLTDDIITINIEKSPYSLTHFFDNHGIHGCTPYDNSENEFHLEVNSEKPEGVDKEHIYTKDRKEAEKNLIFILFGILEKTL